MTVQSMTRNAVLAAAYAALALLLPATGLVNLRIATGLYVLAALDRRLVAGLAIGNALAGIPQGPLDVAGGFVVGLLTAVACAYLGERLAPVAVLVVPVVLVPLWLTWLAAVPYPVVVLAVLKGQAFSAAFGWALLRDKTLRRVVL